MFWDVRYFIFALPALLLAFYAQYKVKSAYATYTKQANSRRITGLDAAQVILRNEQLDDVSIEGVAGELTDHYDPRAKKLGLSAGVARVPSVASLAIVAHEIGHALQHHYGYAPLRLRGALVPAVQVSSWVAPILFLIGFWLNMANLAWVAVILFGLAAVFALVTLPVEFDASRRGLRLLQTYQLADGGEMRGAKTVLDAAALTYVAALAQTLATLLYYVTLLTGSRRED